VLGRPALLPSIVLNTGHELSSNPTLDRESFQKLLASAFAVQASGMKSESLAAILELQKSIRMGHLDVDGAAHLIVEWARSVANASGVAMGRLKGDQLIYTAGSGSAAAYIGRRVMATFSTSAPNEEHSEILRVEDTTTDGRIEAAVSRQFGVKSLLILPIYRGRFVAGVLQVLFNKAHSFQNQEVRTYWILSGLVGQAMSQPPVTQKSSANVAPVVTEEVIDHFPAPVREPINRVDPVEAAVVPQNQEGPTLSLPLDLLPLLAPRVMLLMNRIRAYKLCAYNLYPYKLPAYQRKRISGLMVASVILVCTWILSTARPGTMSSFDDPPLKSPRVATQQTPPSNASEILVTAPVSVAFPARQTVRYVAPTAQPHSSDLNSRVKHFGNDVTVRHFTRRAAVIKMTVGSEVHHVSDDVTVRYFKPRNIESQAEPVANGFSQTVAR
jgi:hypothetical protein